MWTEIYNFCRFLWYVLIPMLIIILFILMSINDRKNKQNTKTKSDKDVYVKKSDVIRLIQDNIEEAYERNQVGLDISFLLDKLEELETIER